METVDEFLSRAERYAQRQNLALTTLSYRLFNEGKLLPRLKRGDVSITVKRLEVGAKVLTELELAEKLQQETAA